MLQEKGSPIDLMLRGFDRGVVLECTGVDIGYNGRVLREAAAGTDRLAYKAAHVAEREGLDAARSALAAYAAGASKTGVLAMLGIAGENVVKLKELYALLELGEEFAEAGKQARHSKMKQGMLAKHGVENPFELAEFQEKAGDTREAKYGARYTLAAGSSLAEGARVTAQHALDDPIQRARIIGQRRATNQQRRGVDAPAQHPEVIAKMRATSLERHGEESFAQTAAARATSLARYGVDHPSRLPDHRAAASRRMSDPDLQRRSVATKRRNGTFTSSAAEKLLHGLLVERFGADDVRIQHRDEERYPWASDFYIPSRDLFVELNGAWTHGGHWYDEDSSEDRAKLAAWGKKDTAFYRNAVVNWSVRDVAKRERARQERLNYVVLWDGREAMEDVLLWLELGAPDGVDWDREHSWLPARQLDLDLRGKGFPAALDGRAGNAREAARAANWRTFYERELALWDADAPSARGRTQGELYANRLHHLGKAPSRLSDFEVLNGLSISGRLRKYTTFDNSGMVRVLEQYGAKSVYDPCAGWGERLATCAGLGIEYFGVDISAAVVEGHQRIVDEYGLTEQRTEQGDAALAYRRQGLHDTVFTCPPYGDAEIYTEDGAENLDEQGFLAWWADVVHMSTGTATETFAYQINQKWKERMNQVLEEHGWRLVDQIAVGTGNVSHFNRTKGGGVTKREFEEVQVFRR